MRIVVVSLIPTAALAYILGLVDPGLWARAGLNISRFILLLGVRNDLWGDALAAVYETLIISVFGVSCGVLLAYLLAPLASPLLAPRTIAIAGRILANSARTVPAILWAILFVILVGPGVKAGALSLAIYTSTYLAKFFYEALESVDRELLDSLRAMGLRGYILAFALYTHIRRQVISSILFMLEYNVRTAAILGFVGAGGVGYYILQYLSILDYPAVLTFVIATIAIVAAIDIASYILRTRI